MPTKRFTNLQQMGPIVAEVDADGDVIFPSSTGGGGAVTVADGADVTQGAIADAAVTTNAPGTISGKLRGAVTLLGSILARLGDVFSPGTAGQDSVLVAGGYHTVTQSATAAGAMPTIDCANFASLSVHVTSIGVSVAAIFEYSNDGTTWEPGFLLRASTALSPFTSSANSLGIYAGNKMGRYFRIRLTAYGSGTYTAIIALSAMPAFPVSLGVSANMSQVNGSTLTLGQKVMASSIPVVLPSEVIITTLKTAQSTATASGSALALWTPAAGKKFRLREVSGRASIAGRYEIRDGAATVIGYLYLDANRWITIMDMEANGYLSAAANNVLNIYNVSGSPADMDFLCSGNEE